jgi:hypothetical protein
VSHYVNGANEVNQFKRLDEYGASTTPTQNSCGREGIREKYDTRGGAEMRNRIDGLHEGNVWCRPHDHDGGNKSATDMVDCVASRLRGHDVEPVAEKRIRRRIQKRDIVINDEHARRCVTVVHSEAFMLANDQLLRCGVNETVAILGMRGRQANGAKGKLR